MNILGKCRPESETLEELYTMGYDSVELYITKEMLEDVTSIIEICKNASISIESVHSPHIGTDIHNPVNYFQKADMLADAVDATYLLHSNPFSTFNLVDVYPPEEISTEEYCYENHPDVSSYAIEQYFLGQNYPIALDIAHLYIAEENYIHTFEKLITSYTKEEIPIVHLADGTRREDGLYFGDGTMELDTIFKIVSEEYSGKVVLEIPTDSRSDALKYAQQYTD